eukprot:GEMP01046853.1.p1 GENE.GEMP01046853.1~~GEMP01046853.1.p1  ORF type:complete len:497 (+),score=148.17 GEMP01046853.1:85-1575(+)
MISADLVASYLTANPRIRVPWAQFGYVPQALIEAAREVDFIVQIIDHELLGHFREAFKATKLHDFLWFARTLVNAGIYEVDNVVAFLGGVLNLFLGISRAQCPWTRPDGPCTCGRERACTCRKERAQVSWKDMVDYFLTAQADNDAYRPPFGQKLIAKQMFELRPEIKRANVTDHFKHHGSMAGTDYWSSLETLVSAEEDTICLWSLSPKLSQLSIKVRIPKMQVEVSPEGNLSCDVDIARVVAVAFDDKRLVTALMTNRLLVTWSMSHRDTKIFAQKWEFQMENPQDNLWYGHHRGNWITTDTAGRLSFWDLQTPIIGPKGQILPNNVLLGHSAPVPSLVAAKQKGAQQAAAMQTAVALEYTAEELAQWEREVEGAATQAAAPERHVEGEASVADSVAHVQQQWSVDEAQQWLVEEAQQWSAEEAHHWLEEEAQQLSGEEAQQLLGEEVPQWLGDETEQCVGNEAQQRFWNDSAWTAAHDSARPDVATAAYAGGA